MDDDPRKQQMPEEDADLLNVMGTNFGRRFVMRQFVENHALAIPFVAETNAMYFNAGQSAAARKLLEHCLRVCPALYLKARQEWEDVTEEQPDPTSKKVLANDS